MIGIDLGTTNTSCAVYEAGEPHGIPNDRGNRVTPSIVSRTLAGDILVGEAAKNQAVLNAERTIRSVKRLMGTGRTIQLGDKTYTPEMISSFILKKVKDDAEAYLGREVREAVITVPAYFTELQRRATIEAGNLAGLEVRRIINEPTAAGLSCAESLPEYCTLLVFDLGGGTFDVSVLKKKALQLEVLSTAGDNHFGGMDFDQAILRQVIQHFNRQADRDIASDPVILQQLTDLAERGKIELSTRQETQIALPFFQAGTRSLHLTYGLTRKDFNTLIAEGTEKACTLTLAALRDAALQPEKVDYIVFSGGSSRIPVIRQSILNLLPAKVASKVHPEEVVAGGAAVQAYLIKHPKDGRRLQDITPLPLGVRAEGDSFFQVVGKNTPIPARETKMFTTVADGQQAVEIDILQGLSPKASKNSSLGKFHLFGIQEASEGVPRIEVSFSIDEDGILTVKARDKRTGVFQDISLADKKALHHAAFKEGLQGRLAVLSGKVEKLMNERGKFLENSFIEEINEILNSSRNHAESLSAGRVNEYCLALETIICEIESLAKEKERKDA
ncbi:MAG: Hsp70 family protein [Spirochaetales bacterium]|nr:Hsp70 family protein [Spirochaetales bacterium]